jgi:hypothetical protein
MPEKGKIERWHQTLKIRVLLEHYFLPGELEAHVAAFVEHYNHQRYHESLGNLTPPTSTLAADRPSCSSANASSAEPSSNGACCTRAKPPNLQPRWATSSANQTAAPSQSIRRRTHPVHAGKDMVVGDQIAQRSRHQQLSLAPYPAAEHRPPPAPLPPTSESDQQGFFNRPRVHFARNALAMLA